MQAHLFGDEFGDEFILQRARSPRIILGMRFHIAGSRYEGMEVVGL